MVQELCIIRPRVRSATCALTKFFDSNKAEKDVKQRRHTSASLHKLHLQHILEIQGQSSGEKQFVGGLVVGWVDFLCLSERSLIKITWRTTVCVSAAWVRHCTQHSPRGVTRQTSTAETLRTRSTSEVHARLGRTAGVDS